MQRQASEIDERHEKECMKEEISRLKNDVEDLENRYSEMDDVMVRLQYEKNQAISRLEKEKEDIAQKYEADICAIRKIAKKEYEQEEAGSK